MIIMEKKMEEMAIELEQNKGEIERGKARGMEDGRYMAEMENRVKEMDE
jgi:hypothetical protein